MALSQINVAISQNIPTAGNDVQEECPICYESFTNKTFASDCLHDFCYQCIRTWVKVRATCPLCLQPIAAIIKNVRSIDDYDIEQVVPPKTNVFEDYLRDFDMPEDILEYESSVEESMSMVSDFEDYEDESSGSNDNLQSAPHSLNGSSSNSQGSLFGILDVYGSDEDELSDISFSENVDSSSEDDEDDKDDDDDESDENHSDNENGNENESEEFYEDNDDEDDYDDNDNEDDYGDDGAEYYEGNLNSSDSYDDDYDDEDYDSYQWNLVCNPFLSPAFILKEKQVGNLHSIFSKPSDIEDTDSDQEYSSSINTANLVYSSNYY